MYEGSLRRGRGWLLASSSAVGLEAPLFFSLRNRAPNLPRHSPSGRVPAEWRVRAAKRRRAFVPRTGADHAVVVARMGAERPCVTEPVRVERCAGNRRMTEPSARTAVSGMGAEEAGVSAVGPTSAPTERAPAVSTEPKAFSWAQLVKKDEPELEPEPEPPATTEGTTEEGIGSPALNGESEEEDCQRFGSSGSSDSELQLHDRIANGSPTPTSDISDGTDGTGAPRVESGPSSPHSGGSGAATTVSSPPTSPSQLPVTTVPQPIRSRLVNVQRYVPSCTEASGPKEVFVDGLVDCLSPQVPDEDMRNSVFLYVASIVERSLGAQVFHFGSGPLKTYLPDGDLDVSIVLGYGPEYDNWEVKVMNQLHQTKNPTFPVSDVFCVDAEVKIVKCFIGDLAVDISVNQVGGFSSLGFFEEMDVMVGKRHLFKKASILVKAWCFYESRILGSNTWLLSTYALQTLVLYVFNLFHKQLHTPLDVLYAFLRYYSEFDWSRYCLTIEGPVLFVRDGDRTERLQRPAARALTRRGAAGRLPAV